MKIITFKHNNKEQVGILTKDEQGIYPIKALDVNYNSMNDLIENITDKEMELLISAVESDSKEIISIKAIT